MSIPNDVASLFKRFGGRADQYLEFPDDVPESAARLQSVPISEPAVLDMVSESDPVPVAIPDPLGNLLDARPSLAQGEAEAVIADVPSAWSTAGLQSLLATLDTAPAALVSEPPPDSVGAPDLAHLDIVVLVSSKGGVGKTTHVANLARQSARPCLLVDLDPQNAVRHHLHLDGCASTHATDHGLAQVDDWSHAMIDCGSGLSLVPYGMPDEAKRRALEDRLDATPVWLADQLEAARLPKGTLVIIDTPAGPSPYLRQALSVANLAVVVSLADAASYTVLPQIDALIARHGEPRDSFNGAFHLINQVDASRALSRDIARVVCELLGDRVIGLVPRDDAFGEALALGRDLFSDAQPSPGAEAVGRFAAALFSRLKTFELLEQPA